MPLTTGAESEVVPLFFIAGQAMFGGREKPGAKRAYPDNQ